MTNQNRAFAQTQVIQSRIVRGEVSLIPKWFTEQVDINSLKKLTFADIYAIAVEQPQGEEEFKLNRKHTVNTRCEQGNTALLNMIQEVLNS